MDVELVSTEGAWLRVHAGKRDLFFHADWCHTVCLSTRPSGCMQLELDGVFILPLRTRVELDRVCAWMKTTPPPVTDDDFKPLH